MNSADRDRVQSWLDKWQDSDGNERANYRNGIDVAIFTPLRRAGKVWRLNFREAATKQNEHEIVGLPSAEKTWS